MYTDNQSHCVILRCVVTGTSRRNGCKETEWKRVCSYGIIAESTGPGLPSAHSCWNISLEIINSINMQSKNTTIFVINNVTYNYMFRPLLIRPSSGWKYKNGRRNYIAMCYSSQRKCEWGGRDLVYKSGCF
jgi:hypothetical protein